MGKSGNFRFAQLTDEDMETPNLQKLVSRREFLKNFIPSGQNELLNQQGAQTQSGPQKLSPESQGGYKCADLTRRQFLQFLVAAGTALTAEYYLGVKPAHAEKASPERVVPNERPEVRQQNQQPQPMPQSTNEKPLDKQETLSTTALQSALFLLAEAISAPIAMALKLPVGNASFDKEKIEKFMETPFLISWGIIGVAAPLIEEAIFRALPQLIISNTSKGDVWMIGVPVSIIFALAHNFKTDETTKKLVFADDTIPLYQFIGGLFFWKMMRERGFPHAVLAHSTVNSSVLTVAKILYEALPNNPQTD